MKTPAKLLVVGLRLRLALTHFTLSTDRDRARHQRDIAHTALGNLLEALRPVRVEAPVETVDRFIAAYNEALADLHALDVAIAEEHDTDEPP